MNRDQLLNRIEDAWAELSDSYAGLSESQMTDLHAPVMYGGIDAFNALMTEERRRLSLSEVRARSAEVHQRLLDYVAGAPEELFATETRWRHRLRVDTYGHYRIHSRAIRKWRGA